MLAEHYAHLVVSGVTGSSPFQIDLLLLLQYCVLFMLDTVVMNGKKTIFLNVLNRIENTFSLNHMYQPYLYYCFLNIEVFTMRS